MAGGAVKCVFLFMNIVILIFCAGAAGLTAYILSQDSKSVIKKSGTEMYAKLGVASLAMLVSFLGCCGAFMEQKVILILFSILMSLILIILIALVYLEYGMPDMFDGPTRSTLKEYIKKYANNTDSQKLIDDFQKEVKCCGITDGNIKTSWQSWAELNPTMFGGSVKVPDSCCKSPKKLKNCRIHPTKCNANLYDCVVKRRENFNKFSIIFMAIYAGIISTAILGIILSCCLMLSVKKDRKEEPKEERQDVDESTKTKALAKPKGKDDSKTKKSPIVAPKSKKPAAKRKK